MSYTSEPIRANGNHSATAEVKENLTHLKEDATKLAGSLKGAARETVEEGRQRFEDVKENAIERAQTVFTSLENQVRMRPAATLGITLGAGLLLGLILSGRRH